MRCRVLAISPGLRSTDVKPSMRTAWVLRRDFPQRGVPPAVADETLFGCDQCDLGTPEAQPSTASRDELSAVWASESQHGCRGIKITSCPRLGTVATAKVQETFMARYTELTELLKPRAQCGQFLERYPQVKEQNLSRYCALRHIWR